MTMTKTTLWHLRHWLRLWHLEIWVTIIVTWQFSRVTLDSVHNSCDVLRFSFAFYKGYSLPPTSKLDHLYLFMHKNFYGEYSQWWEGGGDIDIPITLPALHPLSLSLQILFKYREYTINAKPRRRRKKLAIHNSSHSDFFFVYSLQLSWSHKKEKLDGDDSIIVPGCTSASKTSGGWRCTLVTGAGGAPECIICTNGQIPLSLSSFPPLFLLVKIGQYGATWPSFCFQFNCNLTNISRNCAVMQLLFAIYVVSTSSATFS